MKRTFVSFLCFSFILLSWSYASDGNRGLEVTSTESGSLTTEPGRTVTASFLVSNNTPWEEDLTEIVRLPIGWQKIVSDRLSARLKPGERGVRLVAFLVPEGSPPGPYQVVYTARSAWDYENRASDSISVVVLPVAKLEIVVEQKPKVVIAGETYEVKLRLVDKGNYKTTVKLKAKSNPAYPVRIEPSEMSLYDDKPSPVIVEVKTDKKLRQKTKNFLEITVEVEDSVFARKSLGVEVVPRVADAFDAYHKLPVEVGLTAAGRGENSALQTEISGRGSLDESGKTRVEFLFRGPDVHKMTQLGRRDEYWLGFRGQNLDLYFGDRSYRLSPLTERSSYGRGGEAKIHAGKFAVGAFYLKSRWGQPKVRRAGSYLEYQFVKGFNVKGNVLMKSKGQASPSLRDYDEKVYSIQADIAAAKALNLDMELGFCEGEQKDKLEKLAFRADVDGQLSDQIRYSLERIYSAPNYGGYYKDIDYTSGSVTFPIYRNLHGNAFYQHYRNNLDLDSTQGTANQEETYQATISYLFSWGSHLSLKYKDLKRADRLLPIDYDYGEKSLKLGVAQTLGKLNLSTYVERGELEDRLLNKTDHNLERYSLYASFRPDLWQTYSLFARIGHSSFTRRPEREKSLGVSARWQVMKSLSLDVRYRKDIISTATGQNRDDLFSTLTYNWKNGHDLTLRTQWSRDQQKTKGEFSFLLTYSVPFRLSVSKKKSIGALKGVVYDEDKPGRPGIPNVVLTANGKSETTDRNGEFSFSSLEPGTYYLRLQKNSIGLNRIAAEKVPLLAEVEGAKTTDVEIGVVTSCRIAGSLIVTAVAPDVKLEQGETISKDSLFVAGPGKVEEEEKGLGNILVEIAQGEETLRQLTDEKGRFSFEDIRPGMWTLKIDPQDLPPHHYLEKEQFQIELKSGQEKEVEIKVLPRLRQIQIIDQGEIK